MARWRCTTLREVGERELDGIEALRGALEPHTVEVGVEGFLGDVEIPQPPFSAWTMPDLRLRPGYGALDAGQAILGINNDFAGGAPDLGAGELGRPVPNYGPRPLEPGA